MRKLALAVTVMATIAVMALGLPAQPASLGGHAFSR